MTEQTCLRCNKNPALKDGSDEGEYHCKECIEIRERIERETIEKNKGKENEKPKI